eukprot:61771-Ditylum_brightwellii.AAC.1
MLALMLMMQAGPLLFETMMDIIFAVTNMAVHSLVSRLEGMRVANLYTILHNCNFLPPDFMDIIYKVLITASDEGFVQH